MWFVVFLLQLIGVSVTGLEPEFQPLVNYLLPHITSHKQDAQDVYLQVIADSTLTLVLKFIVFAMMLLWHLMLFSW